MTQEDKELLLKDLNARLPYGVKIELTWWVMGEGIGINTILGPECIRENYGKKNRGNIQFSWSSFTSI